jgi:hypothetical protein
LGGLPLKPQFAAGTDGADVCAPGLDGGLVGDGDPETGGELVGGSDPELDGDGDGDGLDCAGGWLWLPGAGPPRLPPLTTTVARARIRPI